MIILKLACCAVVAVAAGAAALFSDEKPAATVPQPSQGEVFHPPAIDINHLAKAFR